MLCTIFAVTMPNHGLHVQEPVELVVVLGTSFVGSYFRGILLQRCPTKSAEDCSDLSHMNDARSESVLIGKLLEIGVR